MECINGLSMAIGYIVIIAISYEISKTILWGIGILDRYKRHGYDKDYTYTISKKIKFWKK